MNIKKNTTFIYEYRDLEENKNFIDIDAGTKNIKRYFIEDYIENIKNGIFFWGFIKMYAISKMYNTPILIFIKAEKNRINYFKKLLLYDNSEKIETKLEKVICLYYKNEKHYQ